jgi:hypothetical protein
MVSLAMTLPLLPGKTEDWKRWVQEIAGTRLSEFQASRKRLGITREASFLQQTSQGDMAILYIEAEDMVRAFQGLATLSSVSNPFSSKCPAYQIDQSGSTPSVSL